MKTDNYEGFPLADLSRFRGELMGLAIVFVVFFHVYMSPDDFFFPLRRLGNIGVDMFLFISGFGLWFSWNGRRGKDAAVNAAEPFGKRYAGFLKRRLARVYPVWLAVAGFFYTSNYIAGTHTELSPDIPNLALNILFGWSFWRMDDLTFWYVPATMLLYVVAPLYMELSGRWRTYRWLPVLMVVFAAMVAYVPMINHTVGHLEIFFSRIPIFLIGINAGEMIKRGVAIEKEAVWLVALVFVASGWLCMRLEYMGHARFPLFLERIVYIPLTVSALLLECRLIGWLGAVPRKCLAFLGGISLEIYLLHIQYVIKTLRNVVVPYGVKVLMVLAVSVPLAWGLSLVLRYAVKTVPPLVGRMGKVVFKSK